MHAHRTHDTSTGAQDHCSEHDQPGANHSDTAAELLGGAGRYPSHGIFWPGAQLQPDKDYSIEISQSTTGNWMPLAGIHVGDKLESWTVDSRAAAMIATATRLRLSQVSSPPSIDNRVSGRAYTEVNWTSSTSPAYPGGFTFTGSYAYILSTGAKVFGLMAIGIKTSTLPSGAEAITETWWANPDSSPPTDASDRSGKQIQLAASGGTVFLERTTGSYSGACYMATSAVSYL